MKIMKRSGQEVDFDKIKIVHAITKANAEMENVYLRLSEAQILAIADMVEKKCIDLHRTPSVEEVQDMVEDGIIQMRCYEVAKLYIKYRYKRSLNRKANTTDESILSIIDLSNEEIKQENSNKNPTVASVQRDYMAGEVSKDITERILLPEDVVKAHKEGIIHFHDADYFAQRIHNCDLINLEDMLQNGTVISGTLIERPHSFYTACNITTQIVAQVASSQYGGQSFSLAHLIPFVEVSRQKIRKQVIEERTECGDSLDTEVIERVVAKRLKEEITRGIQTIQYQLITLQTTNGFSYYEKRRAVLKFREPIVIGCYKSESSYS